MAGSSSVVEQISMWSASTSWYESCSAALHQIQKHATVSYILWHTDQQQRHNATTNSKHPMAALRQLHIPPFLSNIRVHLSSRRY